MKTPACFPRLAALLLLLLLAAVATPEAGAQYTFTLIADSNSPIFSSFFGSPAINTAGTVAFVANRDAGAGAGMGVFTGAGGATTTIALSTDPNLEVLSPPAINAGGTVAFHATRDAGAGGGQGIFTGAGGGTTTIALSTDPIFSAFSSNAPSINTGGTVAFQGTRDAGAGMMPASSRAPAERRR